MDSLRRGGSLLNEAALKRVEGGAGAGRDADLGIKALDVIVRGLGRDLEKAGRLLGRMPGRDQPQDLDLARREPRQTSARIPAGGLAGCGEDGFDRLGAEASSPTAARILAAAPDSLMAAR